MKINLPNTGSLKRYSQKLFIIFFAMGKSAFLKAVQTKKRGFLRQS